jgi:hypothetical protein
MLPEGWEEKAKELGALQLARGNKNAVGIAAAYPVVSDWREIHGGNQRDNQSLRL